MTLIEVIMAMALITLLCGGLYAVGFKARQFAEHSRLATEARALARERLEEMIAFGASNLAQPSCTLLGEDTQYSSLGYEIVREPSVIWHAADKTVVAAENAAYAEVRVDTTYTSPLFRQDVTDSYSMIIEK